MPYINYNAEDTWQKRLFDKLMNVEDKLDRKSNPSIRRSIHH